MKKLTCYAFLFILPFVMTSQQLPELETYTLKNGLKIYLLKYGKIEAINVSVEINSGKKNETPGQQGYNNITADLVLEGNKKYSQEQQNDKAFALGGELTSSSNFDRTSISGNFLTKDADAIFDLMSAAVTQPLFDKEKVTQRISLLSDYNNPKKMNIAAMASVYSNLSLYGLDNPLGRNIYKSQLEQITVEKIREFQLFNYTPKNTKIIVCGNFKSAEIKSLVDKYFGNWQSTYGEINGVSLDYPVIKKQEIFFVNRSAATQCALQWNKIGAAVKDKDILAFTIANNIFNEILFREIREIGGKTYGIYSNHLTSTFSNILSVSCSVRNNELLNTILLFDKTLQSFAAAGFTKQEFENEITRFKTSLISAEYPEQIADFYDPIKYDFNARKNVLNELNNLKIEDVQKAIKKYYIPNIYKLVIAGDELLVAEQLGKINGLKKYSAADLELKN